MARTTRRQFVQQTAFTAAALYGSPIGLLVQQGLWPAKIDESPGSNRFVFSNGTATFDPAGGPRIVRACEQNAAPLDAAAIRKLTSEITGRVITQEASDYDSSRLVENRAFDRYPALIVRVANSSDVARVLDFGQKQKLPLAVRAGGHSAAGYGACNGGVVIDL